MQNTANRITKGILLHAQMPSFARVKGMPLRYPFMILVDFKHCPKLAKEKALRP